MSSKKKFIEADFPSRLKNFISEDLHISQRKFAKNLGVSPSYISLIIKGNSGPSADFIAGLFFLYRDHFEWLLSGHNKPDSIPLTDTARISQLEERISELEQSQTSISEPIKKGASANQKA